MKIDRRSLLHRVAAFWPLFFPAAVGRTQVVSQQVHLEVVVRPQKVALHQARFAPSLRKSSFILRQHGVLVPIKVAEGGPPALTAHLLVIIKNPTSDCLSEKDWVTVTRVVRKGWDVRLGDASGHGTSELAAGLSVRAACSSFRVNPQDPIVHLQKMVGRRVILLLDTSRPAIVDQATRAIPEVYLVDGGVRMTTFTSLLAMPQQAPATPPEDSSPYEVPCHPVGGRVSPNDPCNVGFTLTSNRTGFKDGVSHEREASDALRDLLESDDRYFDLSFPSPDLNVTSLALAFRRAGNLKVVVTPYSEQHGPGETLIREPLDAEIALSQR